MATTHSKLVTQTSNYETRASHNVDEDVMDLCGYIQACGGVPRVIPFSAYRLVVGMTVENPATGRQEPYDVCFRPLKDGE